MIAFLISILTNNMELIERKEYLEKLKNWKDKDLIKVITWIRRCGKSTIFKLFIEYLKQTWINDNHIIFLNLESLEYDFADYKELYNYINNKIQDNDTYYIFIDEIQIIPEFQKAIDSLYIKSNTDIYITWSNAFLLSWELATFLSWRYIEIKMLPLSFKEFNDYHHWNWDEYIYLQYINKSSFPYALNLENEDEIDEYLNGLFNTILVKDITDRKKISDTTILKDITAFLFSSIWSLLSVQKIVNSLKSNWRSISPHTVESYLSSLNDSFIFNKVPRFDIKWKQYLQTWEKYYATDVTMRYAILWRRNLDMWFILENIVYLELIRRWYKVYVGKNTETEVDFIAENKDWFSYFQVSYTTREKTTLERELRPLQTINDHYPKYLLTMDIDPEIDYNWIKKINVLNWLLKS